MDGAAWEGRGWQDGGWKVVGGPGQRPNLPGSVPGVLLSWASSGQRWGARLLQTATPRAASPELQTHLRVCSTFLGPEPRLSSLAPGAAPSGHPSWDLGSPFMPSPWGSGRIGLGSYRARPPDNFLPVSPLHWKPLPTACPRTPVPSGPLPPLPDTPARCMIHCLGPSEALSLFASRAWTAARAPDCAPQRSPGARLRGKVLPMGQPGCPAWKSRQPPQHSLAAGFARCPAPTSGHHHLSLQRLQPAPGQHPLCPFWSGLPRSTPSMWPPGSCPMEPAGPSRVQTLTSRAVGDAESFHHG
ncbi:unnamed protein product [Rangifer tarandus platyrhynchus]|uniref:Uncharacterized protein n=1 Tax=Rangifer tarandus platyrhynchus TaxID=3082113 RepID=A0AC59ZAR0_RANTA